MTMKGGPICTSHDAGCPRSQDLAASVAAEVRTVAGKDAEVWVLTHSLGGIVLRHIMRLTDCGEPSNSAATACTAHPFREFKTYGSVIMHTWSCAQSALRVWLSGGVRWKGVCMIAPPNRGSKVASKMRRSGFPLGGFFATCYGQAGAPQSNVQQGNPPSTP